nr:unnamed protein product [Spirometra erinaceieuropaei]
MPTVLMVAEKPSLAESLAKILSRNGHSSRRGSNGACQIHEWNGNFRGAPVHFKMTSVCGHVMTMDFVGRYNNWDAVDPIELFTARIEKKEANPKLDMVGFLQREAKGASSLVLWLDCDKEGENICFEVIDSVLPVMTPQAQIFRAHFTAVTEREVTTAMQNLRQPNKNEALSVDARQETDLRIGCAFTRFQTKFFQVVAGDSGERLPLIWNRDRIFDKEAAMVFLNMATSAEKAVVVNVTKKVKVKPRPQGLNTVELLRVASASLGIGPHSAMATAERLYTSGYINYPRTESTAYPPSLDLKALLRPHASSPSSPFDRLRTCLLLSDEFFRVSYKSTCGYGKVNHPKWGSVVADLLKTGYSQPRAGHNAGDHPPIAPMRLALDLSGDAARIYEYVSQHFIATLQPGRRLKPTPLGIVLVHGYHSIDPELVLPHMRRAVEEQLNHIATGNANFRDVLQFVLAIFSAKFRFFVEHISFMDQLFEVSFSSLADCGKPLSRCGKCRRYLKLADSKPQRLHCPACNDTYTIPQNGSVRPYKETKCPLDDFELVLWTQGLKGKTMVFCPYCYMNPPFRGMWRQVGCANCLHPSCPQSPAVNAVDACSDCSQGVLVLDDSHSPRYRLLCNRCDVLVIFSDRVKHASVLSKTCEQCTARHLSLRIDSSKAGDDLPAKFTGCVFCAEEIFKLFQVIKAAASNTAPQGRRGFLQVPDLIISFVDVLIAYISSNRLES